jgi:hypothetical protein
MNKVFINTCFLLQILGITWINGSRDAIFSAYQTLLINRLLQSLEIPAHIWFSILFKIYTRKCKIVLLKKPIKAMIAMNFKWDKLHNPFIYLNYNISRYLVFDRDPKLFSFRHQRIAYHGSLCIGYAVSKLWKVTRWSSGREMKINQLHFHNHVMIFTKKIISSLLLHSW